MQDSWEIGGPYEYFMGRWSRLVARSFIAWLSPTAGGTWVDIGCGSGALSEVIANSCRATKVTAIDQSEAFVAEVKRRLGDLVETRVGGALKLPLPDATVDFAVSGLVLNFIPEPVKALEEMLRVVRPGGTIALYVWDYSGKMEFLSKFWEAAVALDSKALSLHEGTRFPNTTPEKLTALFDSAGVRNPECAPLEIETRFQSFDDYWNPFLGGQGPAPTYLMSLREDKREVLKDRLKEGLPTQSDGSILLGARAWAIRGNCRQTTSS
jgi:SAM-dependent methyltransferase